MTKVYIQHLTKEEHDAAIAEVDALPKCSGYARAATGDGMAELQRYREREPLVRALVAAVDKIDRWDSKGLGLANDCAAEVENFKLEG